MLNLFAVFDTAVKAYLDPFNSPTIASAKRAFQAAANEENHDFRLHAADYTLFHLAAFDNQTGLIVPLNTPVPLGTALSYLTQLSNNPADRAESRVAEEGNN